MPANKFYVAKYEAAEAPSRVPRLHDFHSHFPLTTKQEFAADQAANPPYGTNLTEPLERYTRCHQTSGTNGAPLSRNGWRRLYNTEKIRTAKTPRKC